MRADLRKEPRRPVSRACWIVTGLDSPPQQCQLTDASDHGGKIAVVDVGKVPDKFILLLTAQGRAARKCEVAWRSDREIGLRFLGKTEWPPEAPEKPIPLDA